MPATITLNDYQISNLRAAIEACGYHFGGLEADQRPTRSVMNPLQVLQNGDWMGEIYQMLPEVGHEPNVSANQLAINAMRRFGYGVLEDIRRKFGN